MHRMLALSFVLLAPLAGPALSQDNCATTKAPFSQQTSAAPPHAWAQVNLPGAPGCASDNRVGYGGMSFRSGFGWRIQALRFDDDDSLDLAVTAYNQEAVYVLYGPWSPSSNPPYSAWQVITADCGAQPPSTCPEVPIGTCTHVPTESEYGLSLAAGDVDGDGRDELFVAQPSYVKGNPAWVGRVYVYKWFDPSDIGPCVDRTMLFGLLEDDDSLQKGFGREIAVGEFDGAAGIDLAVAVPFHPMTRAGGCSECNSGAQIDQRGRVRVYSNVAAHLSGEESCTGGRGAVLTIENPQEPEQGSCNGSFGFKMTAADLNGDGLSELFVNAPGNGGSCATEGFGASLSAGQVLLYKGPIANLASPTATLEDVNQLPCCAEDGGGARFGMTRLSVGSAGGLPLVTVGGPRKNLWGFEGDGETYLGCGSVPISPKHFDDPGGAFRFVADDASLTTWTGQQLFQNSPAFSELIGYRSFAARFSTHAGGSSDSDVMYVALGSETCSPRMVYWDAEGLSEPPANLVAPGSFARPPGETTGSWAIGGERARLWSAPEGPHDQIVLGDSGWFPGFTCPFGMPTPDGRLLILFRTYP